MSPDAVAAGGVATAIRTTGTEVAETIRNTRRVPTESKRQQLIVFAKFPRAGEVKTRLVPPLTFQSAAELYRALLRSTFERVRSIRDVHLVVASAVDTDVPLLRRLLEEFGSASDVEVRPQRGSDLGERMSNAIDESLREGAASVCLIGSDHPLLAPTHIVEAFAALEAHDVVIGPAEDGGYYLIGMRASHAELFRNMPYSTADLFRQTLSAAHRSALRVATLPEAFDVDDGEALRRLWRERAQADPELRQTLERIVGDDGGLSHWVNSNG